MIQRRIILRLAGENDYVLAGVDAEGAGVYAVLSDLGRQRLQRAARRQPGPAGGEALTDRRDSP